jgi:hypothetical protein
MPVQKRKPKHAAKPATNAWRVKSAASNVLTLVVSHAAKKPARMTTVTPATMHRAVKVALKAEVRAAVNAPPVAKVAVNVHLAKTTQLRQKACHST